jgi:hypothetical protein
MFTKKEVFDMCNIVAPQFGFEPSLIKAVCLQEGGKNKDGTFAPDRARLEQGFYIRYVENKNELATTSEVLLSASYGVMQMMGLSLKEAGYFDFYFNQSSMQNILGSPLSQFAIPSALDEYCVNLKWQIEWGCKWLQKKKALAKGDINKTLSLWNGDMTGKYANEVLGKKNRLNIILA